MLRRLLNFIVILIIIIAISGIFINLYNSGKKERNKFDTVKESVKKNASKAKDKIKKEKDKIKKEKDKIKKEKDKIIESASNKEDNSTNENTSNQELDDNDVDSSDSVSTTGSEIAVGSTGTKENILLTLVGGVVILSGTGVLIFKTNKFRA